MQTTAFPELELTDYEKRFWSIYKSEKKPGVLNRIYKRTINTPAQAIANLPQVQLSGQIQISRRARIYALTFNGNLDRWRLNISTASGTMYTQKTPRTQLDPVVSSIIAGSYGSGASLGGLVPPIAFPSENNAIGPSFNIQSQRIITMQPFPLLIEPNWLLMPNETLIFNGTPISITVASGEETLTPNLVLNVGIYVWEFPEPNAEDIKKFEDEFKSNNK